MSTEILKMGNPLLYTQADIVQNVNCHYLDPIIDNMLRVMRTSKGVGIAAPQIGVNKRIIIFGFETSSRYPDEAPVPLTILINPTIDFLSCDIVNGWEGCLSVPGLRGLVPRYHHIKYSGYDFHKKEYITDEAKGFHARIIQHEMDHLNGILYPHRITDMKMFGFEGEDFMRPRSIL